MQFWYTLRISCNCNDLSDSLKDFRHHRRVLDQAAASDAKVTAAPVACSYGSSWGGRAGAGSPQTTHDIATHKAREEAVCPPDQGGSRISRRNDHLRLENMERSRGVGY